MINAYPFKNENNSIYYKQTQTRTLFFFFINKAVNRFSKQDYCLCKQKGINGDTDKHVQTRGAGEGKQTSSKEQTNLRSSGVQ